jgi:hypothetical protein
VPRRLKSTSSEASENVLPHKKTGEQNLYLHFIEILGIVFKRLNVFSATHQETRRYGCQEEAQEND